MSDENKMETFDLDLPNEFIVEHFGLGLSKEELAKKIEDYLLKNISNLKNKVAPPPNFSNSLGSFRLNEKKTLKM